MYHYSIIRLIIVVLAFSCHATVLCHENNYCHLNKKHLILNLNLCQDILHMDNRNPCLERFTKTVEWRLDNQDSILVRGAEFFSSAPYPEWF
jgi:hypothetical protein